MIRGFERWAIGRAIYNPGMPDTRWRVPVEFDVFISCADGAEAEIPSTVAAYLTRAGFHVRMSGAVSPAGADPSDFAFVDETPDFILLLTPATRAALADRGHAVHAEVARALSANRNVVCVEEAAGRPGAGAGSIGDLAGLAGQQRVRYDPDRLAESLQILQHSLSSEPTVNERHDMRRTWRWFIFAALFVLAGFSWQTVPYVIKAWRQPRPLPPVAPFTLYWTAFAERTESGAAVEFPLQSGTVVSGGERVRIAFSPSADAFAYVIARDARGRVSVLFPAEYLKGASRVKSGRAYGAPVESGWLTIDPQAGLDTIYVFGSLDPLQNLEELIEEPETPANLGARRELVDQTIAGLLDGRHFQYGRRISIRTTQFIDQRLTPPAGPPTFTAVRPSGPALTHPAIAQPGLVSALVEVRVKFVPAIDAGGHWTNVGLPDSEQFARIVVDPRNADVVYACALGREWGPNEERGLFKTIDGGRSWKKILYKNDLTGCSDVDIDPTNANIVYAGHVDVPALGLVHRLGRRRDRGLQVARRRRHVGAPVRPRREPRAAEGADGSHRHRGLAQQSERRLRRERDEGRRRAVAQRRCRGELADGQQGPEHQLQAVLLRRHPRRSAEPEHGLRARRAASTSPKTAAATSHASAARLTATTRPCGSTRRTRTAS